MKLLKLSLRLVLCALAIAVAAYFTPTPYILRAPGHADDLSQIVQVQRGRADTPGRLYMTTVIYEKANILFCLYSLFDGHAELLSQTSEDAGLRRGGLRSPVSAIQGGSPDDVMEQSKKAAKIVALRKMGYKIPIESTGARVIGFLETDPQVPAASVLQPQDIIDAVDGKPVRSAIQLRQALRGRPPGDVVSLKYRRGKRSLEGRVTLVPFKKHAVIGILTQDVLEPAGWPIDIDISTPNVNGASAGLMFSLEIIDQLTPGGITGGHKIAGTGTIDLDGVVGPIEGTDLKEIAAQRVGATVFLVPYENYADIKNLLPGIQVIKVHTLDEALHAIKTLKG